jgi:hypothetical protein
MAVPYAPDPQGQYERDNLALKAALEEFKAHLASEHADKTQAQKAGVLDSSAPCHNITDASRTKGRGEKR